MGLYAVLQNAATRCPSCQQVGFADWQFYFGGVTSIPSYRVGDRIRWDQPKKFGRPEMPLVFAVAYPDGENACTRCGADFLAEITIEDSRIKGIRYLTDAVHVPEVLYEGAGRTPRLMDELS